MMVARYLEKKSKIVLCLAFISSICARWEQVAVIIIFLLFRSTSFRHNPKKALLWLVLAISIAFPIVAHNVDMSGAEQFLEGGRTVIILDTFQQHFLYFLVVVPKALLLLAGNVLTPWIWFTTWPQGDFTDIQNMFLARLQEFAITGAAIVAYLKNRLTLQSPLVFLSCIYMIVYAANLFNQTRYAYPIYALIALELARRSPRLEMSLASAESIQERTEETVLA
jgi:hypothetical protein